MTDVHATVGVVAGQRPTANIPRLYLRLSTEMALLQWQTLRSAGHFDCHGA